MLIIVGVAYSKETKFVTLTGEITGDSSDEELKATISYPTGFNKNNCVVVASMLNNSENTNGTYSDGAIFSTLGFTVGALPHRVSLGSSDITLGIKNITIATGETKVYIIRESVKINYKIVLMKV